MAVHLHPGRRSWFLKQNCPQDPRHTCYEGDASCPRPRCLQGSGRGGGLQAGVRCSRKSQAGLGPGWSVLLLVLFGRDRGELVLDPETLHEEVGERPVEVVLEGGAVEVMAFVGVYLQEGKRIHPRRQETRGWGARETRGPTGRSTPPPGSSPEVISGLLLLALLNGLCAALLCFLEPVTRIQARGPQGQRPRPPGIRTPKGLERILSCPYNPCPAPTGTCVDSACDSAGALLDLGVQWCPGQ